MIINKEKSSFIQKIEPLTVTKFFTEKFIGKYYQVLSKNKTSPLFISLQYEDQNTLGLQIYWSKKYQTPCYDDNDGYFFAEKNDPNMKESIFTFQINPVGENTFQNDQIYIGIYSLNQMEVCINFSFKTNACFNQILQKKLQKEDLVKKSPLSPSRQPCLKKKAT